MPNVIVLLCHLISVSASGMFQSCGALKTLTEQSGFIRSPIPEIDGLYAYDTNCYWKLTAEDSKAMQLQILHMNILSQYSTYHVNIYCISFIKVGH